MFSRETKAAMRQLLRHRVCPIDRPTKDALSDLNFSMYVQFAFIKACMRPRVFFHPVCFHLRRLTRSYNMCCSVMYSSCLFCSKLQPFFMFSPVPTHACQGSEFDLKGGQSFIFWFGSVSRFMSGSHCLLFYASLCSVGCILFSTL